MLSLRAPYIRRLDIGCLTRALAGVALVSLLAACAGGPSPHTARDANYYRSHARSNYLPPGPPGDPWGPYITQAANRFDVPDTWIREVMWVESGGKLFRNGAPITSHAGAMGLMQVMPGTYEELRERHELGADPFDPQNNILAGTAYIREMYDIYGAPGFLAAYNAGPKRLDDYLANQRGLPDETRSYMAKIGPNILDVHPQLRSQAEKYAMNTIPVRVPPGLRYARGGRPAAVQMAHGRAPREAPIVANTSMQGNAPMQGNALGSRGSVQLGQLASPSSPARAPILVAAPAPQMAPQQGGFRLVPSAIAVPMAPSTTATGESGQWAIQLGAFTNENLARMATGSAIAKVSDALGHAKAQISSVRQRQATLYRARFVGLSQASAMQACERLQRDQVTCVVVSPDARS